MLISAKPPSTGKGELMRMCCVVVLVSTACVLLACAAGAVPMGETRYGASGLRLEIRPEPLWFAESGTTFEQLEGALGANGTGARWVGVVDALGSPEFDSKFIESIKPDLDKREAALKAWVAEIHEHGMAAMSWYPLILSESGWKNHPEWRQKFIIDNPPGKHQELGCCINTGYGQALIDFCNEAIDRIGLDGIWFDGSAFTQIWDRPIGLSCVCEECNLLFKKNTGLEAPTKVDWDDPTFRRWVAWRYEMFGGYIGRLAAGIRRKHPNAAVAINHYHRPGIPWQGAIPLNPYSADIISGSEANGEATVDLTMRLCRAYGRPECEVWRTFDVGEHPGSALQTDELIHHALTCITAGGMPSYGTGPNTTTVPATAKLVSASIDALRPYVGGQSVPYAAMHVSQQSETFYFSREPKGVGWATEPYWKSILGWTSGLMEGHIAPDYVYDKLFTPKNLSKYKVLLMPMSQALSEEQCRTALDFAERGGTLVLGIGAGAMDEWGEKRPANPLEKELGFAFGAVPSPAASEATFVDLSDLDGEHIGAFAALYSPLRLTDKAWQTLYNAGSYREKDPAVAVRQFGRGKVIALGVDLGGAGVAAFQAVTGGDTSMEVVEKIASGRRLHSLKFTDGPNAPQSFYPDMEMRFEPTGAPNAATIRMSFSIRLEEGAQVGIEMRKTGTMLGPYISVGRDGKIWSKDKALGDIIYDKWMQIAIVCRLAGENRTFDVEFSSVFGSMMIYDRLPYKDADFDGCDWAVIFGEGTQPASFYLDNLKIESISAGPEPKVTTILADDFEATPVGSVTPMSPVRFLAGELLKLAPAPIELDAPDHIRFGAFTRTPGETTILLHNLNATRRTKPGDPVTLRTRFPVTSATLALSGKQLEVTKSGDVWEVKVPGVGIGEVVVVR